MVRYNTKMSYIFKMIEKYISYLCGGLAVHGVSDDL